MHFCISNRQLHVSLKMNNMQLADVMVTKFLGFLIQSNLKWNVHITELNTKIKFIMLCIQNSLEFYQPSCSSLHVFCKCTFPP